MVEVFPTWHDSWEYSSLYKPESLGKPHQPLLVGKLRPNLQHGQNLGECGRGRKVGICMARVIFFQNSF